MFNFHVLYNLVVPVERYNMSNVYCIQTVCKVSASYVILSLEFVTYSLSVVSLPEWLCERWNFERNSKSLLVSRKVILTFQKEFQSFMIDGEETRSGLGSGSGAGKRVRAGAGAHISNIHATTGVLFFILIQKTLQKASLDWRSDTCTALVLISALLPKIASVVFT